MSETTNRQRILTEMLRRFHEAHDAGVVEGVRGDGGGWPHMASTWNASYRTLDALLDRMKPESLGGGGERPSQWWHVTERYLRCEHRVIEVRAVRRRNGQVDFKLPPHTELEAGAPSIKDSTARVRVAQWSSAVRAEKVRRGIEWLAESWPAGSEPYLPAEFLEGIAA